MDTREFKGLELAARAKIEFRKTYWYVASASHEGGYNVNADATTCTCEDFELRQKPCKHIHAVRIVKDRNRGKPIPEVETAVVEVPTARPTYKQNWTAYNKSQVNEKEMFQELLADLCKTIPWAAKEGRGRPRIPVPDAVFSACFKVYSTFSGRRFSTDLRDAKDAGHIDQAPHYNSVFRVLEDANTTAILKGLVIRSSLPLRSVETQCAADGTGFSTSKFARWFDHKWGVERRKAEWIKCHAMCGVKTNVVTACEVNDSGDSPMFKQLATTTATNFEVKEISADKAYSAYENLEYAEELGAVPLRPLQDQFPRRYPPRCVGADARSVHSQPGRVLEALPPPVERRKHVLDAEAEVWGRGAIEDGYRHQERSVGEGRVSQPCGRDSRDARVGHRSDVRTG